MSAWRLKGSAGPLANQAFPLGQGLWFRERTGGSLEVLQAEAGDALARLTPVAGGPPRLEPVGAHTVQVNGRDWAAGPVAAGDEIRIGTQRFLVQAPGLRPERVLETGREAGRRARWPWWLAAVLLVGATLAWWWLQQPPVA